MTLNNALTEVVVEIRGICQPCSSHVQLSKFRPEGRKGDGKKGRPPRESSSGKGGKVSAGFSLTRTSLGHARISVVATVLVKGASLRIVALSICVLFQARTAVHVWVSIRRMSASHALQTDYLLHWGPAIQMFVQQERIMVYRPQKLFRVAICLGRLACLFCRTRSLVQFFRRSHVLTGGRPAAQYFNLGARVGGQGGMCSATLEQPDLVRYVSAFLAHLFPEGTWTSICVSHNEFAHIHQDFNSPDSQNYDAPTWPCGSSRAGILS